MDELSLEELNLWYAKNFLNDEDPSWANGVELNLSETLSDEQRLGYTKQLTSVIGDDFYSKHSQEAIAADPDLTYHYYWAIAEASNEQKLRALYQSELIRKNNNV